MGEPVDYIINSTLRKARPTFRRVDVVLTQYIAFTPECRRKVFHNAILNARARVAIRCGIIR